MKISTLLFCFLPTLSVVAQVPAAFNYQAVVRDGAGTVVSNQNVSFRISLLKGSETGIASYVELHSVTTNSFGLANFKIGKGSAEVGTFGPEGWGDAAFFVKIELDPAGGLDFQHLSTVQLMAVPYAFHAQTVANDAVEDADADPTNEIQMLSIEENNLSLSNGGGTVALPIPESDNWGTQSVISDSTLAGLGTEESPLSVKGDLSDNQTLAISGQELSISGGNSITLPDEVNDADPDPTNEIQMLSIEENNLSLSNGGGTVALPIPESDNWGTQSVISDSTLAGLGTEESPLSVKGDLSDNQTLAISGQELSISGGNSITLPDEVNDADPDPTNEIQNLAINGNNLSISGGNSIVLPQSGNSLWSEQNGNIYYDDGGKVGIGTIPNAGDSRKFQVITNNMQAIAAVNNSAFPALFAQNNNPGSLAAEFRGGLRLRDGSEGAGKVLVSDDFGYASWQNLPAASSLWSTNLVGIHYTGGPVGIGTSAPNYPLDINLNQFAAIRIKSTNTSLFAGDATLILDKSESSAWANLNFRTNGSSKFWMGLLGEDNFYITANSSNQAGMGIFQNGDVFMSDNLYVGGELNKLATGDANMMPLAYGSVTSNFLRANSGNVAVTRESTGRYLIEITGEFYYFQDYISNVTLMNIGFVRTGSVSGRLIVNTYDTSGTLSDMDFQFIVFKP